MSEPLLALDNISVRYGGNSVSAVRDLSLSLAAGEILGLVGESGSGKTTVGYAILGHLGAGRVTTGAIRFSGRDLLAFGKAEWAKLRGREIGMVYQEPQSALNPAYTIGEQIAEGLRHHFGLGSAKARTRALDWIARVHLPEPAVIFRRFPHQLSGGQLQRAVIAMAFALEPRLVVMDEPTTGLDVTTQARILALVAGLCSSTGVALLYISHDLAVVAELCDRVMVLHRGRMVEEGRAREVLASPLHPYTQRLVASIPDLDRRRTLPQSSAPRDLQAPADEGCSYRARCQGAVADCASARGNTIERLGRRSARCWRSREVAPITPIDLPAPVERDNAPILLELRGVEKVYRSHGHATLACADISFDVKAGECVALVGESGSGKTTLARCVLGLETPNKGAIRLDGTALPARVHDRARSLRRRMQLVFQNPDGSLNGRRTIGETLRRPLLIHGRADSEKAADRIGCELMASVDLPTEYLDRYPHELSGGEKQRVAIARALACEPDLIVFDEPVSSLDVSVQSTILDLCRRLQASNIVSFLFITHDLGVVRQVADRALVMHLGRICHMGSVDSLFAPDAPPYVRELVASIPGRGAPNRDERNESRADQVAQEDPDGPDRAVRAR
ncbi:peptide/nickel transport system ATP-binding protein [Rhizobiales bacterium GAS113]|nr:peptide/nickel transport system ATP-binding protein [Rhizobiales bacterium GAS113]